MQSSLRDLLSWVWQIVLSWVASLTTGIYRPLCFGRSANMVVKANDPEIAVRLDSEVLEDEARLQSDHHAVLQIEGEKRENGILLDSVTRTHAGEVAESDHGDIETTEVIVNAEASTDDSEADTSREGTDDTTSDSSTDGGDQVGESPAAQVSESPAAQVSESPAAQVSESPAAQVGESPAAQVGESPAAQVGGLLAAQVGESPAAQVGESPAAQVGESPAAQVGESPAAQVGESPADQVGDSTDGENANGNEEHNSSNINAEDAVSSSAEEDINRMIIAAMQFDLFDWEDENEGSTQPAEEPKNEETDTEVKEEDIVNEDDEDRQEEEEEEKDTKEDDSVTWLLELGPKETYQKILFPKYQCLNFRTAVALDRDKVNTALKQLRCLLPWLGIGLKRRKKDMWLCLHPEESINFKMMYGGQSLWDAVTNSSEDFSYLDNNTLPSFTLMKANPCDLCHAFVDSQACTNPDPKVEMQVPKNPTADASNNPDEENRPSSSSSGSSPCDGISNNDCGVAESENKSVSFTMSNCTSQATECNIEFDNTASSGMSTDASPGSLDMVGCDNKDSTNFNANPCPSENNSSDTSVPEASSGNNPSDTSVPKTSSENNASDTPVPEASCASTGANRKTFPHNYRLLISVPHPLADDESVAMICDGFLRELDSVISRAGSAENTPADCNKTNAEKSDVERTSETDEPGVKNGCTNNDDGAVASGNSSAEDGQCNGETKADGEVDQPQCTGEIKADGEVNQPQCAGETKADSEINQSQCTGETKSDSLVDLPQCTGETKADGEVNQPHCTGETKADSKINQSQCTGETKTDIGVDHPQCTGETKSDTELSQPQCTGETKIDSEVYQSQYTGEPKTDSEVDQSQYTGEAKTDSELDQSQCTGEIKTDSTLEQSQCTGETMTACEVDQPHCTGETKTDSELDQLQCTGETKTDSTLEQSQCTGETMTACEVNQPHCTGETKTNSELDQPQCTGETKTDSELDQPQCTGETKTDSEVEQPQGSGMTTQSDSKVGQQQCTSETEQTDSVDEPQCTGETKQADTEVDQPQHTDKAKVSDSGVDQPSNSITAEDIAKRKASVAKQVTILSDIFAKTETPKPKEKKSKAPPNNSGRDNGKENENANAVDRNSSHVLRTIEAVNSRNFINKCKSKRISYISAFAICVDAAIGTMLTKSGVKCENADYKIGHNVRPFYNLDDLTDNEWHDHDPNEEDEDDDDDEDQEYSLCCRKPTVSLNSAPSDKLSQMWEKAQMIDPKCRSVPQSPRESSPQIIPLDTEYPCVDDSRFAAILQPEANLSITNISDLSKKFCRQQQNLESLTFEPIPPHIAFLMTHCVSLNVRNGILNFSFYNPQNLISNVSAHDYADEIASILDKSL